MIGTKILKERNSKYNGHLVVKKTFGMGTYIQSDGLTQSGGIVEQIWKQTIKRIAYSVQRIERILILGLGGGTVAKLLRKKYPKARIVGVEIDPIMIELGEKYLNLGNYGVDIKIQDAKKFKFRKYDLVITDTYFGDNYIDLLSKDLLNSKIVIFNRLFFGDKKQEALKFKKRLEKIYKKVETFYPTANVMFFCYNS